MKTLTKKKIKEYEDKMLELTNSYDAEVAHIEADGLLSNLLKDLGLSDLAKIYDLVGKWYA